MRRMRMLDRETETRLSYSYKDRLISFLPNFEHLY